MNPSLSLLAILLVGAAVGIVEGTNSVTLGLASGPNERQITVFLSSNEPLAGIQVELTGGFIFTAVAGSILDGFFFTTDSDTVVAVSLVGDIIPSTNGESVVLAVLTYFDGNQGLEVCLLDTSVIAIPGSSDDAFPMISPTMGCAIVATDDFPSPSPPPLSPPSLPSPSGAVLSDPHMLGLRGQEFDFTGSADKIYALVSDTNLAINARFGIAWMTALTLDPDTLITDEMQMKGTWICELGIIINDNRVLVSVETSSQEALCPSIGDPERISSCFYGGSIQVNGVDEIRLGQITVDENMSINFKNFKSYGRVSIVSPELSLDIDYVPPPAHWKVPEDSVAEYSHLNMRIQAMTLSERVDGVLGQTSRINYDANNNPIFKGTDADGSGVLNNPAADFEVSSIFGTDAKINQYVQ